MPWLEFLNENANLLLVVVTGIYATLTYFYVREARLQRLQQIALYVRLVFQKAPDKVLVENIGPGIAAKVMLQGFIWKDGEETWQCTFEPVYTILPREVAPLEFRIESPDFYGRPLLDDRAVFQIAFRQAAPASAEDALVLELYSEDIFGNGYASQVRVDGQELYTFLEVRKEQRWNPVTLPPVRERKRRTGTPGLVDRTKSKRKG